MYIFLTIVKVCRGWGVSTHCELAMNSRQKTKTKSGAFMNVSREQPNKKDQRVAIRTRYTLLHT